MKRVLSITGVLAMAILFTSAISIGETPQDPPRDKKGKKHIKMVKVGDDGKKMEIDTVIAADEVFVWNGDTIGGEKEMKWVAKEGFKFDMDQDFDFDFDVEADEDGNVFVFKSGEGEAHKVMRFKADGDSAKQIRMKVISDGNHEDIMKWHSKGGNEMIIGAPHGAHAPKMIRIEKKGGNVIDLSDPGIISFEKKDLKDGKEKITIVREKPSKEEVEVHEEIIMHGNHSAPMFIHENGDVQKVKQIKVIAGDEGNIEILEDGKVWSIDEMDEGTKVIEKDGKKIIIKKQKTGKEMKIDVEVEEEIHEEKEHEK